MKLKEYLLDQKLNIFLQLLILVIINMLLFLGGISNQDLMIVSFIIVFLNIISHSISFARKRNYYNKLVDKFNLLEEKNLICEFIDQPQSLEAQIFYDIILESGYALNNKIAETEKIKNEYREYIEGLVHEIKLPISVIKMIAEKYDDADYRSIKEENEKIEAYIEQALYYARSNNVEKDYFISDTDLNAVIRSVLRKHKNQFISKNIKPILECIDIIVLSDAKWLEFILSQLIDNAIKYSSKVSPIIKISTSKTNNIVNLSVTNNGITIPAEDITKVFDKGFTGQNGRKIRYSTGIGLYLVNRLCKALGHKVSVVSENELTTFTIIFSSLE